MSRALEQCIAALREALELFDLGVTGSASYEHGHLLGWDEADAERSRIHALINAALAAAEGESTPLDEAAVRADERAKIVAWLDRYGDQLHTAEYLAAAIARGDHQP